MRIPYLAMTAAGLLCAPLSLQAQSSQAQSSDRVDLVSAQNFQTTVKQLETTLQSQSFMITGRADHQNMLRMVGASTRGALSIDFGKPDMMKTLLPAHPELGLEMPMRMYVWERADGKTVVSYRRPSALFSAYAPEVAGMGPMMDTMFEQIARAATR